MGYYLKAIVGNQDVLQAISKEYPHAKPVPLYQDLGLIPMTEELFDEMNQFTPSHDEREFLMLSNKISALLSRASTGSTLGYMEADFFGGHGGQAAIVWDDGKVVFAEEFLLGQENSINKALKLLGVVKEAGKDEFDTVGLGRHRYIEDWLVEV